MSKYRVPVRLKLEPFIDAFDFARELFRETLRYRLHPLREHAGKLYERTAADVLWAVRKMRRPYAANPKGRVPLKVLERAMDARKGQGAWVILLAMRAS